MQIAEFLTEKTHPGRTLPENERHALLRFVYNWLVGTYMGEPNATQTLSKWQEVAAMFPPKVRSNPVMLYRLVTVPLRYAELKSFTFAPARTLVSSWCSHIGGLDPVEGVAADFAYRDNKLASTARIAIRAALPADLVLATPLTIRQTFNTLAHDYFYRYPEREVVTQRDDGTTVSTALAHPDYPGGPDDHFDINEVGYMLDVVNRRGGHLRQYECVLRTPREVQAQVVRIYRIGEKQLRIGNDDPHN